jgi:hypothetical protein
MADRYERFPTYWQPQGGPVREISHLLGSPARDETVRVDLFSTEYFGSRIFHLVSCIDFRTKIVTNRLGICHLVHKVSYASRNCALAAIVLL